MSDSTFERVRKVVCEELGRTESEVTMEASFMEDLGADSLDVVELVMNLEEEFGLDIPDEAVGDMKTVGAAVAYIDKNSGA